LQLANSTLLWFFERTVNVWVVEVRVIARLDVPETPSIKAPVLADFALARPGWLPVQVELEQPGNFLYF